MRNPGIFPIPCLRFLLRPAGNLLARSVAGLLVSALAAPAQPPGSCAPGPRELFDFQVGDIFQYRLYQRNMMAKTLVRETLRKYQVVSRLDSGATRIYGFAGREERVDSIDGVFAARAFADYAETKRYADGGASDPLNGCPGDTVTLLPDTTAVTVVEARQGDTSWFPLARPGQRMKRLGGKLWVRYEGKLHPAEILDQKTYAEGVGLAHGFFATMSVSSHGERLVGYVKGGDTVGTVSPDARFFEVSSLAGPPRRRPGPSRAGALIGKGRKPFDARGRRLPAADRRGQPR